MFFETLIIYLFYIRLQKINRVHEIFFLNARPLVGKESVSKTYGSGVWIADNDSSPDAMCFHTSWIYIPVHKKYRLNPS